MHSQVILNELKNIENILAREVKRYEHKARQAETVIERREYVGIAFGYIDSRLMIKNLIQDIEGEVK